MSKWFMALSNDCKQQHRLTYIGRPMTPNLVFPEDAEVNKTTFETKKHVAVTGFVYMTPMFVGCSVY